MGNKKDDGISRSFALTLFVIFFIMLLTLYVFIFNIHKQLDNLPKKVCHTEESMKKIELKTYCSNNSFLCSIDQYNILEGETATCEEGVKIFEVLKEIVNYEREPKVCLIKTKK